MPSALSYIGTALDTLTLPCLMTDLGTLSCFGTALTTLSCVGTAQANTNASGVKEPPKFADKQHNLLLDGLELRAKNNIGVQ